MVAVVAITCPACEREDSGSGYGPMATVQTPSCKGLKTIAPTRMLPATRRMAKRPATTHRASDEATENERLAGCLENAPCESH